MKVVAAEGSVIGTGFLQEYDVRFFGGVSDSELQHLLPFGETAAIPLPDGERLSGCGHVAGAGWHWGLLHRRTGGGSLVLTGVKGAN